MKTYISIISVIFLSQSMIGQGTVDTTGIPSENVEVIKNYEASIAQSSKKEISIDSRENNYPPIVYQYSSSIPKAIDFNRPDPVIRAMAYNPKEDNNPDIKDGTIYGAYGNLNTIKAGAAYHYYIEDWLEAGIDFKHFSAKDESGPQQKYYHTSGELYAGYYFTPNTKIRASGLVDYDRNYSVSTYQDSLPEFFTHPFDQQTIKLDFSHTAFEKLGLSIRASIGYDNLKQKASSVIEKSLFGELNFYKKISDNVAFELPGKFSKNKLTSPGGIELEKLTVNEINTTPALHVKHDKYQLNAGVRYFKGYEKTIVFPDIKLNLNKLFAGFDLGIEVHADIDRVSLSMIKNENPYTIVRFLNDGVVEGTPYGSYQYIQNYKIHLSRELGVHQLGFSTTYRRFDLDSYYQFDLEIGNYNLQLTKRDDIIFNLNYTLQLKSGLSINTDLNYTIFMDGFYPQYIPDWTGQVTIDKKFGEKLDIGLSMYFISKRTFILGPILNPINEPLPVHYPNNFDLGLYMKYRISPSLNIFVESSNLLASNDYAIWYDNPVLERQVWGGLQFNF